MGLWKETEADDLDFWVKDGGGGRGAGIPSHDNTVDAEQRFFFFGHICLSTCTEREGQKATMPSFVVQVHSRKAPFFGRYMTSRARRDGPDGRLVTNPGRWAAEYGCDATLQRANAKGAGRIRARRMGRSGRIATAGR